MITTADDVRARVHTLHQAVWELAAISIALRQEGDAGELRDAAANLLVRTGLAAPGPASIQPTEALAEMTGGDPSGLASQAAASILQAAAVLTGAEWTSQDDDALLAQGRASAQGAEPFKMFLVPMMDGLADRLTATAQPVMLDVGVGVAAMAAAWCNAFPGLRVVGLDVFPRALELARRVVDEADMVDRIELRRRDVADLDEHDVYTLAWLPAPFVPRHALEAGLPRVVAAVVPGGWVIVGHGRLGGAGDEISDAITRFQTVAYGGTPLDNDEAHALLANAGLELVTTLPTPPGTPVITVGRRPTTA